MTERKLIFIASPYAGDVEKNIEFARAACRYCIEWGHTPFAPHLLYPQILDDNNPDQREAGLKLGRHVLEHCDEIWMCGNETSPGMRMELEAAESMNIPIRFFSRDQILDAPDPVYVIWAKGQPDGPLAGQSGFLCENRKRLFFSSIAEAEVRIRDIRNLCLNTHPAAELKCVEYPVDYASKLRMHLETLKDLDMAPGFDPNKFEVRSREYGDTGGRCMVAAVECYLPDLDKSVWVNCNDESVTITSADYIWNEDMSDSWERYEDVRLYSKSFGQELPDDVEPWLPMIRSALEYTIKMETAYAGCRPFSLPAVWAPDSIRQKAEPYLDWLQSEGKNLQIESGGRIAIDEAYLNNGQDRPDIGTMVLQ